MQLVQGASSCCIEYGDLFHFKNDALRRYRRKDEDLSVDR